MKNPCHSPSNRCESSTALYASESKDRFDLFSVSSPEEITEERDEEIENHTVAPTRVIPENSVPIHKDVTSTEIRTESWLAERIELIWKLHFSNVRRISPIVCNFGIVGKNRFGSISLRNGASVIRLNRLFADPELPLFVLDETLAHELVHYAHGFGSKLPRLYADPHRGGVIDLEMEKRGLTPLHLRAEEWRKAHWDAFHSRKLPGASLRKKARNDVNQTLWDRFLTGKDFRKLETLQMRLEEIASGFGFADAPPFDLEWLYASTRQTGLSYSYPKEEIVRIHGVAASRLTPDYVIDFELAYWVAREAVGGNWRSIENVLHAAGYKETTLQAIAWRNSQWNRVRIRLHPLK